MKKFLLTLIVCLVFALSFNSCTKDFETYSRQQIEENKYAISFEKAFGKIASTVDWGFATRTTQNLTRGVSDYTNYKGNMQPNISWPTDCDASMFNPDLTGVPSYDEFLQSKGSQWWTPTEINEYAEVYIDHVRNVKMTGGNERSKLYLKPGTYDFTNEEFNMCANADVYLLSGATLILNNTAASTAKFNVYIAQGAELKVSTKYRADVDAHVYNHGTITCAGFEVNGTSTLYNVGTISSTGELFIENSTAKIVNDGDITCTSTFVKGSGALQNNAEWTVTGNTVVNCNNGGWVNNGHWTTQNYYYTAGSENVINNCFLEVKNDFNINMSSADPKNGFKIDSNGGVLTKNFYGGKANDDVNSTSGPYKIFMGNKSLFKVTNTATLEGGNKGWGFFGPADGDYAVFQAKDIVRNPKHEGTQGAVTYGGNLYVSAETHFAQGHDGMDADGHYFISEVGGFNVNTNIFAAGFSAGLPDIEIDETPCNPGFKGGKKLYRVIAEDLSASEAGDFDFNDVVFDIVEAKNGKTTLRLIAAGGTLPLRIAGSDEYEVHKLFGVAVNVMVNTGAGPNLSPVEFEINGEYKTPEEIKNILIEVNKGDWLILNATTGKAACKILVDNSFIPVKERRNIANEYGLFTDYVQGNFVDEFWWK